MADGDRSWHGPRRPWSRATDNLDHAAEGACRYRIGVGGLLAEACGPERVEAPAILPASRTGTGPVGPWASSICAGAGGAPGVLGAGNSWIVVVLVTVVVHVAWSKGTATSMVRLNWGSPRKPDT